MIIMPNTLYFTCTWYTASVMSFSQNMHGPLAIVAYTVYTKLTQCHIKITWFVQYIWDLMIIWADHACIKKLVTVNFVFAIPTFLFIQEGSSCTQNIVQWSTKRCYSFQGHQLPKTVSKTCLSHVTSQETICTCVCMIEFSAKTKFKFTGFNLA